MSEYFANETKMSSSDVCLELVRVSAAVIKARHVGMLVLRERNYNTILIPSQLSYVVWFYPLSDDSHIPSLVMLSLQPCHL